MAKGADAVRYRPKLIDGIDGFHAAYARGHIVPIPQEYAEMIIIPAVLHTPWQVYRTYPPAVQAAILAWLPHYLAAGQGLNPDVIHAD